ncbi:MAG: dihydroorotate dehydrogenase electron transfer subunit [Bacteroidales bacterium]
MFRIIENHIVVKVESPAAGNFIISLRSPVEIPEIMPGNFAEIQVPDAPDVFLRRPFSILDVDYGNRLISFYVKAIGKGTRKLGALETGKQVHLIYPLGNSFTLPEKGKKVLIVAGGSGIAPFILLAKELRKNENEITFLLGARTANEVILKEAFAKYGMVCITTEDGSDGEKGLVTHHSLFTGEQFPFDKVYACGPDPMMKAVATLARNKGADCEVSLENMMGCGFGVCLCCVTPTIEGNKRVCWEGPVFNSSYLTWQT